MNDQALPGPGWYPDPNDTATNRYWDGQNWTESRAPIAQSAQKAEFEGADAVGYVLAILLPLIGFIIGLVRLNKSKHGVWIVVTSVVIFILWLALISSAGTASAQTGGVTLEPGTKLTVVCEQKKPFRGLPFTDASSGNPLARQPFPHRKNRVFSNSIYATPVEHTVQVLVKRSAPGLFRLRAQSDDARLIAWRGC